MKRARHRRLWPRWLIAAGSVVALASPSCHHFHACYDGPCPESVDTGEQGSGGESSSGRAGATPSSSGAGAERDDGGARAFGGAGVAQGGDSAGAPDDCEAPTADCDESKLTGCESNLLTDIENCGACRVHCTGVCADGSCQSFETLSMYKGLPSIGGIVHTNTELFVLSNDYERYDGVSSWSEEDGTRTLIDGGTPFRQMALATDRLYLSDEQGALWSLPPAGGTLRDEKQTARSLVSVGGNLYAIDEQGTPYELSPGTGERRDLPLPSAIHPNAAVVMAGASGRLVVLGDPDLDVGGTRFEIYSCKTNSDGEWQRIATGNGQPVQARLKDNDLYVSVRVGTGDPDEYELRRYSLAGETSTLSRLSGVVSFEIVYANLYVSVERADDSSALRILSVDDPSRTVEFRTSTPMRSLVYVEPYFYFGDTALSRFSRLRDWLN